MLASFRASHHYPSAPTVIALLAILLAGAASIYPRAAAQGTHLWQQSQMGEFEKGTPDGISIESGGHLRQGPGLTELLTTPSTFVWSLAVDKTGQIFAGTGSPASVLRLGKNPGEKPFTLFETRDLSIQALRFGPDGALYAATVPGGKVYKLNPDATTKLDESNATVVFDAGKIDNASAGANSTASAVPSTQSQYIWDLTFDSGGRLYIATGNPGAVYRVNPSKLDPAKPGAPPELFFKSDEAHIRTLAWDAKGNLIAGSDGSGLVYRIDAQGKGYVLFEAPRREITSIAIGANGTIYAACVGDKSRNPLPPLPVQGMSSITITVVQPQSLQAANASASVPEGTEIFALTEGQAPHSLWTSKDSIVYALAARADGLLALSGNRGQIYRIQGDGSYSDIAHLQAQQGLSMASAQGAESLYIGTGNIGKVFELGAAATHEYASDVLDAGAFARFGRVEIEPGSSGYDILTRTGNVEQPVRGWSDWQPLADSSIASPPGRFLQWKAVLHAGGVLGSVGVNYLPVNSAPVVDDLVVVPGARINPQANFSQNQNVSITFPSSGQNSGISFDANSPSQPLQAAKDRTAVTVRWAAHDDDGDSLVYSLFLRGDGDTAWWPLKKKIKELAYSFDATMIPDGGYRIKVIASDALSHTQGDALTGEKVSDRFVIDTTPPVVTNLKAASQQGTCAGLNCPRPFLVTFDADDAASPIAHAEYSLDAGPWQYVDPASSISDSRREHYEFRISLDTDAGKIGEHLITVRAYDRYDNLGVAKTIIPAQ
jgi:outer membrane protein assembly factor BamB